MNKNKVWRLIAALLTLVLLVGLLPAGVYADEGRTLEEDGQGGYYLNMPTEGTDTLDISDRSVGFSFKLYDDGGASDKYSNNCEGYLVITAPAGTVLKVSGTGVGEIYNGAKCDYLTLYDGDTDSVLGEGQYSDSFTVNDVVTSGNALKVLFYTDYAINNEGLDLTVTVLSASSLATLTFTYNGVSETRKAIAGAEFILPRFRRCSRCPQGKVFPIG